MNRTLWTVIGILLLVAGVVGLLAGNGALSFVDRQQALLTPEMIDAWNRNRTLATTITIAAGLLLTLLGGLLLRAQRSQRAGTPMRDLHFGPHPEPTGTEPPQFERGGTDVASRALHRALRRDFESDRQVRDATVRLTGPTAHPQLQVRLAVTADADIARLAGHVDRVVHRFRTTSGVQPDLSEVVLRIPERATSRVE
jgi:hypothetical protein